jgi:hypothetical protein
MPVGRTTQATTTAVGIAAALASFVVVGASGWYAPTTTALAPTPVPAPPLAASPSADQTDPPTSWTSAHGLGPTRVLALPPVPTDSAPPAPTVTAVALESPDDATVRTAAETPVGDRPPPAEPPPAVEPDPGPAAGTPPPAPASDTPRDSEPEPEPEPQRTTAAAEPEAHPSDRAANAPGRTKNAPESAADERRVQARLPLTESARHTVRSHGPTHQRPAHPDGHRPGP